MSITYVPYSTEDRQWDIRVNVQTDEYLEQLTTNIMDLAGQGRFKYVLIGGLEVGTKPNHSDYQIRHVHIAVILHNRMSKSSIIKHLGIVEGNGYYLVPRNRELPYTGWKEHHTKTFSKVDPNKTIIFESGELPKDLKKEKITASPLEKKRKLDEILVDMRQMFENGKEEEAFTKYPRNYLIYGARLKSMVKQTNMFFKDTSDPHIWLWGGAGTGKTQLLRYIYPTMYKKDLSNRFFDLYDPDVHSHIMLEDLDPETVAKLGLQFIKTLCDEAGFPIGWYILQQCPYYIAAHTGPYACNCGWMQMFNDLTVDQKYKTPQLTKATILVTSNFEIPAVVPEDCKDPIVTKESLLRRFYYVRIENLLRFLGLKLIDKWDRQKLKADGNTDSGKLFYSYDYVADHPTGKPIKAPDEYARMIRNKFYEQ